jgi:ECF sigma factor
MRRTPSAHEVTLLLRAWGEGNKEALDRLAPLVYRELHGIAGRLMAGERAGHTLQTTALVNEAYLRLVDTGQARGQDRAHFFALMRSGHAADSGGPCPLARAREARRRAGLSGA